MQHMIIIPRNIRSPCWELCRKGCDLLYQAFRKKQKTNQLPFDCIVFSNDNLTPSEHCQVPSSLKQSICFYSIKNRLFLHSCNRKHENSVFFEAYSGKISHKEGKVYL